MRLKGPPVETIKVDVEIDAADQLETGDLLAGTLGIHPQLAALEMLLYPASGLIIANTAALALGTIEVVPPVGAFTLLVWGLKRVLPVRLTEFSITEDLPDRDRGARRAGREGDPVRAPPLPPAGRGTAAARGGHGGPGRPPGPDQRADPRGPRGVLADRRCQQRDGPGRADPRARAPPPGPAAAALGANVLLGIQLTLLIGPEVPVPAPAALAEALTAVEVTHTDEGRSGFQLTFQVGRSGLADLVDYPLLANPLLRTFNRVILLVSFNAMPRVLMDGFITRQQLSPSDEPGASTLTVTGEDVSVMLDLEEKKVDHPAQDEATIARMILLQYTRLLLAPPIVRPPDQIDVPSPQESIPKQQGMTDLRYLTDLASRFGFVFYVTPGPAPGQNIAYWGPPERLGFPQPALSVSMGPSSNVDQIGFQYDALAPTVVTDLVQVSDVNIKLPVVALASTRLPPLASMPSPLFVRP